MATRHNTPRVTSRFFSLLGKCTTTRGNPSYEGAHQSALATFGRTATGSTRDNLLASKLIILWGWNPLVTRFGPDTIPYLSQTKKAGVPFVSVDPRQSQTCHALADEWIPVKPGTDTALLLAMAYVMIAEELLDTRYVENYTHGFEIFREYVTGETDGVPKNPEWAHSICGTPVESIVKLARSYIYKKPVSLIAGWHRDEPRMENNFTVRYPLSRPSLEIWASTVATAQGDPIMSIWEVLKNHRRFPGSGIIKFTLPDYTTHCSTPDQKVNIRSANCCISWAATC